MEVEKFELLDTNNFHNIFVVSYFKQEIEIEFKFLNCSLTGGASLLSWPGQNWNPSSIRQTNLIFLPKGSLPNNTRQSSRSQN